MISKNILKKANNLMLNQDYDKALELYKKAIVEYPELSDTILFNIKLIKNRTKREVVDFVKGKLSNNVFVGIAAIPERELALEKTISSLLPQVEKIGVYLNGWSYIPDYLKHPKIIVEGFKGKDLGDVGKFFWVDEHNGIYFSCDDDLIYPKNYISTTIEKLEKYEFKACVGWHGSLIKKPYEDFYDQKSRRVFTFKAHRPFDTPVHILGTGCCAFHTSIMPVKLKDFIAPNMADIFFSLKGQEYNIPFYVIEHEANQIVAVEGSEASSIYKDSSSNAQTRKNTVVLQNNFVKSINEWTLNNNLPLKLLIIGRFGTFSKGGIYKSCKLIKDVLVNLGHEVKTLDTTNDLDEDIVKDVDLCWIYPGDPVRPDFVSVDNKVNFLQSRNIPVLVNLSYLYDDDRSNWIVEKIKFYNKSSKIPVFATVFTESAAQDRIFNEIREFICVLPKTILPTESNVTIPFHQREGICLGDATKLSNEYIIGGNSHAWIEAIHKRLPHVNLYAYKQYSGKNPPHPKVQFVPHMTDEFGDWMAHRKLFICLNVHLTFEMVACEAQFYGTPAVYRHMPHSLSEYISATGMAVRTPEEMGEMVSWLYNNEVAWNNFSQSSYYRAKSNHVDYLASSLEGYLRLAIIRAKKLITSK